MVSIAGTYNENAEPSSGEFEPIPAGEYRAIIDQAEVAEISKRNDYGNCLVITWKIEGSNADGRLIWQRINLWAQGMNNNDKVISIAESQFAALREAVKAPGWVCTDTDQLIGLYANIRVKIKTDPTGQYEPRNEVGAVKSANTGAPARPAPSGNQQRSAPPPATNGSKPGAFAHLKSGANA